MPPLSTSALEPYIQRMISRLESYVKTESPTTSKESVDALGRLIANDMTELGAELETFPQSDVGDHILGTWGDGEGGILLLTHMDTVHPLGTLAHAPFKRSSGALHGPGILDMKASIALVLTAIEALRKARQLGERRISLLVTSDEETGSKTSRALIEALAENHEVVFCLEPALPEGALKTWRKGILGFELEAHGFAAHAGSEITRGVNAIVEIAMQVPDLLHIAERDDETTLNVGVIHGGTRSNVVPDRCRLRVDVRALSQAEGDRVLSEIHALQPKLDGSKLMVRGGWNRPPMERTAQVIQAFERASLIAGEIGIELLEGGTGGGSDANFVAARGVPVLDGLGVLGRGAHSRDELVELPPLAERTALLAALISEW